MKVPINKPVYGFACTAFDEAGNLIKLFMQPMQGEIKVETQGLTVFYPYKNGRIDVTNGKSIRYLKFSEDLKDATEKYNNLVDREIKKLGKLQEALKGKKI